MNIEANLCNDCNLKDVCKFKENYIEFTIKSGEHMTLFADDLPVSLNIKCDYYKPEVKLPRNNVVY